MSAWKDAFEARTDLASYSDNAIGLFALALKFGVDDLDTIAADISAVLILIMSVVTHSQGSNIGEVMILQ